MEEQIISAIEAAYIQVMGADKWNALTDQQKHDVVMILVKDLAEALDRL